MEESRRLVVHVKTEMLIRHPNGDAGLVVARISLELRGEVNAIRIYMIFRVMGFNGSGEHQHLKPNGG